MGAIPGSGLGEGFGALLGTEILRIRTEGTWGTGRRTGLPIVSWAVDRYAAKEMELRSVLALRDLTPTPLLLWRTSLESQHAGFISRGSLAPEIPFALSPIRQYWIRVMFDVLKAQLTAAGEKLAHLRRFL